MGNGAMAYRDLVEHELDVPPATFLSVDVEDYYHYVPGGEDQYEARGLPSNLERNLDALMALFAERQGRATFFILSSVAPRIAPAIRRMVAEGHEVASHGSSHQQITKQDPATFRADLAKSKDVLEQIAGVAVESFRAPIFSVTDTTLWALDIMGELGIRFDSSVAPVKNFAYGIPDAPHRPHRLKNGIVEVPMSALDLGPLKLMLGGGFYLRLYPLWLHRLFFAWRDASLGRVLYLHPWELDGRDYNPWDRGVEHAFMNERPRLMKAIQTYNRHDVLKKFDALIPRGASTLAIRDVAGLGHAQVGHG
jgi:polysaccharide deacetylase family protein (PEP-CTERM system associated)